MTINGVQGGIGNMSRGGGHLNACPGVVGGGGGGGLEGIIEACPGGVEQHRRLSRWVGRNRSLSRGHLHICPWGVEE